MVRSGKVAKSSTRKTVHGKSTVTAKKRAARKSGKAKAKTTSAKKSSSKTTGKKVASKKVAGKKLVRKKKAVAKKASRKVVSKKTAQAKTRSTRVAKAKTTAITRSPKKRSPGKRGSPPTAKDRVKKSATAKSAVTENHEAASFPEERPVPKTYLTPAELQEFKQLLLDKRRELSGDVDKLSRGIADQKAQAGGAHSTMPIHMADLGSDNWEQEFNLGLIANERGRIREIDDALARIDDKTYGVCLATHKKITHARLRAKPWAKFCIEHARAREEGRMP